MKLSDINKKNIFETPDGYFENLPSIIQSKAVKPFENWSLRTLFETPVFRYAVAAVVLLITFFIGFQNLTTNTDENVNYATISSDEIHDYLVASDFNEYEILEIAQENNIQIIETKTLEITTETLDEEVDLEDLEEFMTFI